MYPSQVVSTWGVTLLRRGADETLDVENERLRQIVGGDGRIESLLNITLNDVRAAFREVVAQRDALAAVIDKVRALVDDSGPFRAGDGVTPRKENPA
jgi:hypothetical protein